MVRDSLDLSIMGKMDQHNTDVSPPDVKRMKLFEVNVGDDQKSLTNELNNND